jgi:hypothetical protein
MLSSWLWRRLPVLILITGLAVAVILLARGCAEEDIEIGKDVDAVLEDSIPAWRAELDSIREALDAEQDSADAAAKRAAVEKAGRIAAQARLRRLERERDSAKAALHAVTQAELPGTASASDTAQWWRNRSQQQDRYILTLEEENAAHRQGSHGYEQEIKAREEEVLALRRLTEGLRTQVDRSHAQQDVLAQTLADLRESTRPGIQVGPVRLPDWVDEAGLVVLTAAATYAVVK